MSEELIPLSWITVRRKVSDLIPSDFNPRKITPENQKRLEDKICRLGFIDIPTIDIDNALVSGHRRIKALFTLGKGDEEIDVRFPNRKLTDEEFKEIMLNSNIHEGEFDFSEVEEFFQEIDFESIGLDFNFEDIIEEQSKKKKEQKDLSDDLNEIYEVIIECISEREQEELFNEFKEKGYRCRVLTL